MNQQQSSFLPSQKLPKKTQNLLKNLKGYSTMLNSSSKFWSDPLTNSNFCSCGCDKDLTIEEENDNNEININKNKDSLFKVIPKNEEEKKTFTKEWTKEEHDLLYNEYFKKGNKNMKYIYNLLQTKSIQQINYRIKKIELKNKVRTFTRQDDLKIIELVEIYGLNWVAIANNFPGFKAEALEERYYNKLDPKLKRTKFTEEEDEKIINLYLKFGNNWKEISNYFEDRNANMIKNRFYSFLKKKRNIQTYANSSSYLSDKDLSSASIVSSNSVNNDNDLLKDINNDIKFEFNNLNFDDFNNNDNNNNSNPFFNNKLLIDDNIKVIPLNDDYYYSNNNINYHKDFSNNSSNGSSANNKNINNNLNDEKFNQTFLKVFNNKYDEIDNNNNQMNIDENELLINYENNNEEKEQLLNESQRLEEILSKIDKINNNNNNNINNNYNINNNINIDNNNMNIEENNNDDKILYNDLIKYNNKINNIQILLKKKLYLLKENQDDFNKEKITEINDVLLKLISIGKAKIMINLKLKDLQKNKINI